jgi:hypothetical protein
MPPRNEVVLSVRLSTSESTIEKGVTLWVRPFGSFAPRKVCASSEVLSLV